MAGPASLIPGAVCFWGEDGRQCKCKLERARERRRRRAKTWRARTEPRQHANPHTPKTHHGADDDAGLVGLALPVPQQPCFFVFLFVGAMRTKKTRSPARRQLEVRRCQVLCTSFLRAAQQLISERGRERERGAGAHICTACMPNHRHTRTSTCCAAQRAPWLYVEIKDHLWLVATARALARLRGRSPGFCCVGFVVASALPSRLVHCSKPFFRAAASQNKSQGDYNTQPGAIPSTHNSPPKRSSRRSRACALKKKLAFGGVDDD